jgi:hypothetical protein
MSRKVVRVRSSALQARLNLLGMAEVKSPTLLASTPRMHSLQKLPGGSVLEVMAPSVGAARFSPRGETTSSKSGTRSPRRSCSPPLAGNLRRWR